MSEWQPIETAPKDGTEIDMWWVNGYRAVSYRVTNARWDSSLSGWTAEWDGLLGTDGDVHRPTHWMPLPAPPSLRA